MEKHHNIHQTVGVLIDGNNVDMGVKTGFGGSYMIDYLVLIPKILRGRSLSSLFYFREGLHISDAFRTMLRLNFFGVVKPCGKSADISLAIEAVLLAAKVNTIIIFSGDVDFCPLVEYLKSVGVRVEIVYATGTESKVLLEKADDSYYINRKDLRQHKPNSKTEESQTPSTT